MALTLKLDTTTGFEPAYYRFAGGSIASLPRREMRCGVTDGIRTHE